MCAIILFYRSFQGLFFFPLLDGSSLWQDTSNFARSKQVSLGFWKDNTIVHFFHNDDCNTFIENSAWVLKRVICIL